MDYYHILLHSDNLHLLNQVCSEFHTLLQDETFWKEKTDKERIEPEVTCLQEWCQHKKGLHYSTQEGTYSIRLNSNPLSEDLPQIIHLDGLDPEILKLVIIRKDDLYWSIVLQVGETYVPIKEVDDKEKISMLYRMYRGSRLAMTF